MAYARLKGIPIVLAETIQRWSDEIPEEARTLLTNSVQGVLVTSEINVEKVSALKISLSTPLPEATAEQHELLSGLIKSLFKDLRSPDL